jgi:hypothetical protein
MDAKFEAFLKSFFEAIKKKDQKFIKNIYGDWVDSSGVIAKEQKEQFFEGAVFVEVESLAGGKLVDVEILDEYYIAHLKYGDGETELIFKKKNGTWIFFNEMFDLAKFKLVYTINYEVSGGPLMVKINGKRTPVIRDFAEASQGMASPINSALVPGKNEISFESSNKKPIEISIQINGERRGDIAVSTEGNVLDWKGVVKDKVSLTFKAE